MSSNQLNVQTILCASPTATRAVPVRIDSFSDSIVYGSGNSVIVRTISNSKSLNNTLICNLHKSVVTAVRFSHSGEFVASGDLNGNIIVWKNGPGTAEKFNSPALQGAVRDIAFSNDDKTLMVCGEGKTTFGLVFSIQGESFGAVQGHARKVMSGDIRSDSTFIAATGCADGFVAFHEKLPIVLKGNSNPGHENTVNLVRFSPDGKELVTASSSPKLFIFDVASQKQTRIIETQHKGTIYGFAWSRDGTKIATCSADKSVHVMDYVSGAVLHSISFGKEVAEMQQGITAVSEGFVSTSLGGVVRLLTEGQVSKTFAGHQSRILSIFVNSKNVLVSLSVDGRLLLWENGGAEGTARQVELPTDVACAAATLGDTLYIAAGKQILVFDTSANDAPAVLSKDVNFPNALAVTSKKTIIALYKSKACIVDAKVEKDLPRFDGSCADAFETKVALGGDNILQVFDTAANNFAEVLSIPHRACVSSVQFSRDGTRLVTGDVARNITVWDASNGSALFSQLTYHSLSVAKVCFDPTGKFLISGGADSCVIVWNLEKDTHYIQDNAHKGGVSTVCWGPKGELLSAGGDFCIASWKVKS